jgi:hypothetical protein
MDRQMPFFSAWLHYIADGKSFFIAVDKFTS